MKCAHSNWWPGHIFVLINLFDRFFSFSLYFCRSCHLKHLAVMCNTLNTIIYMYYVFMCVMVCFARVSLRQWLIVRASIFFFLVRVFLARTSKYSKLDFFFFSFQFHACVIHSNVNGIVCFEFRLTMTGLFFSCMFHIHHFLVGSGIVQTMKID